ncbi:nitrite reductase (NADH) small subunit [Geodermatophilus obscurus]|uniref:Nitrite reductase (NADH) small subunit n=1 Tax=Geodermatophilus obscurus TaxID=1861 RepID=A0A1M7UN69_9ACTN|nr:Rieske (2Fe-2S) protein [Geodermatophilus obscurus]SHN84471.1 nitrite reductase (NADH) small subunit [Geodermatophilus obscurus]
MSATTRLRHLEAARPTTPGTDPGSPAGEVRTPGPAPLLRGEAYAVGRVEEVPPGEGRAFVAGGVPVAVFRLRDGSLHATQAACPHAGGPLADGQTDVDVLVCPLHLYAYRWTDGASTSGAAPVRVYPVRDSAGEILVEV